MSAVENILTTFAATTLDSLRRYLSIALRLMMVWAPNAMIDVSLLGVIINALMVVDMSSKRRAAPGWVALHLLRRPRETIPGSSVCRRPCVWIRCVVAIVMATAEVRGVLDALALRATATTTKGWDVWRGLVKAGIGRAGVWLAISSLLV